MVALFRRVFVGAKFRHHFFRASTTFFASKNIADDFQIVNQFFHRADKLKTVYTIWALFRDMLECEYVT